MPAPCNDLVVDLDANIATRGSRVVRLAPQQAVVLWRLHQEPGAIVSSDELMDAVYGKSGGPDGAYYVIRQVIKLLRRKIETLGLAIVTYSKRGYALADLT